MVSKGLSTIAKETEMRNGAKTPAAYFIITKRMEIEVTSMRNWFMGHAFCIIDFPMYKLRVSKQYYSTFYSLSLSFLRNNPVNYTYSLLG